MRGTSLSALMLPWPFGLPAATFRCKLVEVQAQRRDGVAVGEASVRYSFAIQSEGTNGTATK